MGTDVDVDVNGVVVSRSAVPFACQSNGGRWCLNLQSGYIRSGQR